MKLPDRLSYILHHYLVSKEILESGWTESNHEYRVVRRKYWFRVFPTELNIEAADGVYSSIWEDRTDEVPYYPSIQKHILKTVGPSDLTGNALVLGAAGCAIPRFLCGKYPQAKVVAVECSKQLVGIAKRYFLKGIDADRLELVNDDAFLYVERTERLFDLVFVDLFEQDRLVPNLFDPGFYENMNRILSPHGVVYMNLWGIDDGQMQHLQALLENTFSVEHLFEKDLNYLFLRKK